MYSGHKPLVDIKDCFLFENWQGNQILTGIPLNYPDEHQYRPGALENGRRVYTSAVVKAEPYTIETQRTIYRVINWLTRQEYETSKTEELRRGRAY